MQSNALDKSRLLAQRTRLFALGAIRLRRAVTGSEQGRIIGRQLLRSATSVGANYRAAMRSRSKREFVARIGVCVEEADESGYWLDLLADAEVVSPDSIAHLRDEAHQLTGHAERLPSHSTQSPGKPGWTVCRQATTSIPSKSGGTQQYLGLRSFTRSPDHPITRFLLPDHPILPCTLQFSSGNPEASDCKLQGRRLELGRHEEGE